MSNFQNENHPHVEDKSEKIAEEFNEPPVAGKAIDTIDDHTPANPNPPEHSDTDPSDGRDKLRPIMESVKALAENLNALTNVVSSLVKDEKVNKSVPWTHRGGRNV